MMVTIILIIELMIFLVGLRQIFNLEKIRPTEKIVPKSDDEVKQIW